MGALAREGTKIISFLVFFFVWLACSGVALAGGEGDFLAGENMNGVEVGAQQIEKADLWGWMWMWMSDVRSWFLYC